MQVLRSLKENCWRNFLETQPISNVFHTPEMFEVYSHTRGYRPELWAVTNDNKQVLALFLPVKITLYNGFFHLFTSRSVVYGGFLSSPGFEGREALTLLIKVYKQHAQRAFLFTEVRNQYDTRDVQQNFNHLGFDYEGHFNYLVNLALPEDKLWDNIHESARRNIKKALRKNQLIIEEVHDRSQVEICYSLLKKTYKSINIPLADQSLFEQAFDILYQKGMVKFLLGRVGENYIATSVSLIYKDVIYGWYRGFDRTYSSYLPNDLMVWYLLQWGAKHNYRVFDFGGAGKPDQLYGPRDFKTKFGGTLVNYGRYICVHAPLRFKLSQIGYQLTRRITTRL